jgi:hypothetical protein
MKRNPGIKDRNRGKGFFLGFLPFWRPLIFSGLQRGRKRGGVLTSGEEISE